METEKAADEKGNSPTKLTISIVAAKDSLEVAKRLETHLAVVRRAAEARSLATNIEIVSIDEEVQKPRVGTKEGIKNVLLGIPDNAENEQILSSGDRGEHYTLVIPITSPDAVAAMSNHHIDPRANLNDDIVADQVKVLPLLGTKTDWQVVMPETAKLALLTPNNDTVGDKTSPEQDAMLTYATKQIRNLMDTWILRNQILSSAKANKRSPEMLGLLQKRIESIQSVPELEKILRIFKSLTKKS